MRAVKRWLELPGNDSWLLVYDNYDNPRMNVRATGGSREGMDRREDVDEGPKSADAYDIRPFLPDSRGAIIITTQSPRVRVGQRIALGKLNDPNDSLEILSHTSGRREIHEGKSPRFNSRG